MLSDQDLAFARLARNLISPSQVDECLRELHVSDSCLKALLVGKGYLAAEDIAQLEQLALADKGPTVRRTVALNTEEPEALAGQWVAGYKLLRVLGSGGKGVVYGARDEQRTVRAVKILRPEAAANTDSILRFTRESQAMHRLRHRNIVEVYETGFDRGLHYITMEYVPGASLWQVLKTHGRMSVKATLKLAYEILRALRHAHSRGIVHRDIKPQNVLIQPGTKVKLTDFGVASIPDAERYFRRDVAVGTAVFMPPEQSRGEAVDGRADLYSLGVLLFHCLTGAWPFVASTRRALVRQHQTVQAPCPKSFREDLRDDVAALVLRCLQKDPADRFASADAMLDAVRQAWKGPRKRAARSQRSARKRPVAPRRASGKLRRPTRRRRLLRRRR